MKESDIEEIFQEALAVAFYDAIENEPAVVSLIFKTPNEAEKPYNFLKNKLSKDEVCLVLKPANDDKINLTFIDKKNNQVYNVENITYQEPNFEGFKKKYKEKYCLFLTMFISAGEVVVSSECQDPMLINEIIFQNSEE
ncbi:hypothetical protein [Flavobacterium sp. F52]|uniref:hypothetical protein n=1 Tax=Flavobacterium sp. F52 TaxID=1202532 RepID=UPI000272DBF5|nr:hypothetical protein [Flavobacterium sp. F52]EJG03207.1 hypothetical protein FF52_03405 [Flavobacterium sp. F52]